MSIDGTVVVFGGTGAVGRATLDTLRRRGRDPVVATWCNRPPPEAPGVAWARFDAVSGAGREELSRALDRAGGAVRAVVFTVGGPSSKRPVAQTPEPEWGETFAANALSFVHAYAAVRGPAHRGRARVVALGSDATRTVGPGNGPYTAAKAALEAIALTLAKEEAEHGVRVNVLAPSLIDSPMAARILRLKGVDHPAAYATTQPWGRLLTAEEVAEAAVSMALDPAWEYATGQVVRLAARL
jgi:NAD(P)-dependent dehydrogenase (short-subunit alcohol dehydrogenase family)